MQRRLRAMAYAARRGLAQVSRTPLASAAIVLAVAASLIAIGVLRLASHNLEGSAQRVVDGPALIVYLEANIAPERAEAIGAALSALEGTAAVDVVSPARAKARLELELAANAATLADLDATFFPTTIEVALRPGVREAAALHPFVDRLERIEGVESVDVLGDAIDRAALLVDSLRSAARLLSLFLTACAVFVIVVLVRSSTGARFEERQLYLRLGASPAFAATPDLIAGMIRGLAGGLVAVIALYIFYAALGPAAEAALNATLEAPTLSFLPGTDIAALSLGGLLLGAIGAALADRGARRA